MMKKGISLSLLLLFVCCSLAATGQQQQQQVATEQSQPVNFPYYMQSPIAISQQTEQQQQQQQPVYVQPQQQQKPLVQRVSIPRAMAAATGGQTNQPIAQQQPMPSQPNLSLEQQQKSSQQQCLYDKRYFAKFDECLSKRPYPTIGLPAFKNEDLLVKQQQHGRNSNKFRGALGEGSIGKRGCSFILSNGLFKNYLISNYALDSDTQCLDSNGKVSMSLDFSNVTLYYLWQLRCLNYANQLLDDSIANAKLVESLEIDLSKQQQQQQQQLESSNETSSSSNNDPIELHLCAGSSQTFGFASMQLSQLETQIELVTDVYKNWRITNVTVAYMGQITSTNNKLSPTSSSDQLAPSFIKDFTFDSLDGDELNWRYMQMYSNWTRNRLHTNFLEQFKRFIWISLQRCLSEHSVDKLPIKLVDIFGNHKYN